MTEMEKTKRLAMQCGQFLLALLHFGVGLSFLMFSVCIFVKSHFENEPILLVFFAICLVVASFFVRFGIATAKAIDLWRIKDGK